MLEICLIVISLCVDAFAASVAYGASKIKIPILSAAIITVTGSSFLALSLLAANFLARFISPTVCIAIGFGILFLMGVHNLFSGTIKAYMKKKISINKTMRFKSGISLVLDVYLDETIADLDASKVLSAKEALYLATALSMDSLFLGFGSGLNLQGSLMLIGLSLVLGFVTIYGGCLMGQLLTKHDRINISWLAGVILIALSMTRLIKLY